MSLRWPGRRHAGYAIRRAYQRQEAHVDQVDACQTERDLAGEHSALVQHMVDQVEQRGIGLLEHLGCWRLHGFRRGSPPALWGSHDSMKL